jgi:hypothetical protein
MMGMLRMSSGGMTVWIFLAAALTLPVFVNDARGERLIEIVRYGDGGAFYYDRDSVKKSSEKVRVWMVTRLGKDDAEKERMILSLQSINTHQEAGVLSDVATFLEIECAEGRVRVITSSHYDGEGRIHYSDNLSDRNGWRDILPGSFLEKLKRKVCRQLPLRERR